MIHDHFDRGASKISKSPFQSVSIGPFDAQRSKLSWINGCFSDHLSYGGIFSVLVPWFPASINEQSSQEEEDKWKSHAYSNYETKRRWSIVALLLFLIASHAWLASNLRERQESLN